MNKDYILSVLKDSMREHLREPRWGLKEKVFEIRSTKLWAMDEVLRAIKMSSLSPKETIRIFIRKCRQCAKLKKGTEYIFLLAIETAEEMLDIVIAME